MTFRLLVQMSQGYSGETRVVPSRSRAIAFFGCSSLCVRIISWEMRCPTILYGLNLLDFKHSLPICELSFFLLEIFPETSSIRKKNDNFRLIYCR